MPTVSAPAIRPYESLRHFSSYSRNLSEPAERVTEPDALGLAPPFATPFVRQTPGLFWEDRRGCIHQIGADATARYNATQSANDNQHAGYWAQQDANARTNQGFQNYLLDQTVVQDNNMYGNGTVGHGTAWNSTADALVRSDPNRFEYVNTPNYWRGVDY